MVLSAAMVLMRDNKVEAGASRDGNHSRLNTWRGFRTKYDVDVQRVRGTNL